MKVLNDNEKLGRMIEDLNRELDQQRREILTLDHEKKLVERNDVKMNDEIIELKTYLNELKSQRDRITSEVKPYLVDKITKLFKIRSSEESKRFEQRRLDHLIQIVRDMEGKQQAAEALARDRINELESELRELTATNQRFAKDYDQAKVNISYNAY